jgi:hypothetical protein
MIITVANFCNIHTYICIHTYIHTYTHRHTHTHSIANGNKKCDPIGLHFMTILEQGMEVSQMQKLKNKWNHKSTPITSSWWGT